MRKFLPLILLPLLVGCLGHTSSDNELTGQVKRVQNKTPLLCPDYTHVDISLGVMRGGVGSMSTQDIWLWVKNPADIPALMKAAENGAIVKVKYSVARGRWFNCVEHEELDSVQVLP